MDYNLHTDFQIEDKSYLALIKNKIREVGHELELSEEEIGKLNIIATELVTNLVKYGERNREILVKPVLDHGVAGIEIISLDKGDGAKDPLRMMQDGYSTSGTKGEGLGAVQRLSDEFDIYTHTTGTIVLARVYQKDKGLYPKPKCRIEYAGIMVARKGEIVCGDQWFVDQREDSFTLAMIDGLGHGPNANQAAVASIDIIKDAQKYDTPDEILTKIHENIKRTRGAVGLIAKVNFERKNLIHCGVGNIGCKIISPVNIESNKSLILFNGILGLNVKRMNSTENNWDANKILIMHSDGLNTRWDLNQYPGIYSRHPSIIAAILYRDFNRRNDDITIVVARTKRN